MTWVCVSKIFIVLSCRNSVVGTVPLCRAGWKRSDVLESFAGQSFAHVVDIQPQLATGQPFAYGRLARFARLGSREHVDGFLASDHADAIVVRDDDVAG